ncbi:MAG: ribonuclease H-like YkuK family protein [Flavobacteriaceae bacterium]
MLTQKQIEDMVDLLIECDDNTKVYLGCDSVRYIGKDQRQKARFATVAIVHMNGNSGCRIFSQISHENDYDMRADRPKMRMMKEVQKVCELYTQIGPFIDEFDIEIHLDINTDPRHGSNCAASEAAGYVLGMTGIQPKLKPESWAASFGADGVAHGKTEKV